MIDLQAIYICTLKLGNTSLQYSSPKWGIFPPNGVQEDSLGNVNNNKNLFPFIYLYNFDFVNFNNMYNIA